MTYCDTCGSIADAAAYTRAHPSNRYDTLTTCSTCITTAQACITELLARNHFHEIGTTHANAV